MSDDDVKEMSPAQVKRVRRELIADVGRSVMWNRMKTKPLEIHEDVDKLTNCRVIWNPVGTAWIMVFMTRASKPYSFFLQKSKMFQPNPGLIGFRILADMSLYNGTIIEGQMVIDRKTDKQVFIMQDVHMLCGDSLQRVDWYEKMVNLRSEVERKLQMIPLENTFEIAVETGTPLSDLRKMHERGSDVVPWKTRGMTFMPAKSGIRWNFVEADPEMKEVEESFSVPKGAKIAALELHKSAIQDVYQLFCADRKGGRKDLGLASIPTITVSRMCIAMFKQQGKRESDMIIVRCYQDKESEKWVPFELAANRRAPDKV